MKADSQKVNQLLKTARGQLEGILKMVEEDRYCIDVSNQLQATMSILRKANTEILRAHIHQCVRTSFDNTTGINREQTIDELIDVLDKSVK